MIEVRKLLIFVFVLVLLFYTCRLLYATRYKSDKAYIFIIMICGLFLSSIGTFLDMIGKIVDEQVVHDVIRMCLTLGSISYIIGIILWSRFTKNMIEELERMASTDPLTGALNRNGLEKKFQALIKKKKGFYLCVCDLDGTKSINDTFGHMEGDRFISNTVGIMKDLVGKNGWISRIGGDEFIILLEIDEFLEIDKMVAHIREKIFGLYPEESVGISIGYAQFPEDGENFEELTRKADAKMYSDKNAKQM